MAAARLIAGILVVMFFGCSGEESLESLVVPVSSMPAECETRQFPEPGPLLWHRETNDEETINDVVGFAFRDHEELASWPTYVIGDWLEPRSNTEDENLTWVLGFRFESKRATDEAQALAQIKGIPEFWRVFRRGKTIAMVHFNDLDFGWEEEGTSQAASCFDAATLHVESVLGDRLVISKPEIRRDPDAR